MLPTVSVLIHWSRDEDVTITMYPEIQSRQVPEAQPRPTGEVPGKVNRVCNAFIDYLRKERMAFNIQSIVTAYVCKTPPDAQSALELISTLKGNTSLIS